MCTNFRESDVCFQRAFVFFIRALRLLVQAPNDVPAAFDITELLSVRDYVPWMKSNTGRCLVWQYFRFESSSQQSCFYRAIQSFLSGLCTALVTDYQQGDADVLCLMSFDPIFVFGGPFSGIAALDVLGPNSASALSGGKWINSVTSISRSKFVLPSKVVESV